MKYRIFLLAALLALSCTVTACKGKDDADAKDSDTQTQTQEQTAQQTEPPKESQSELTDTVALPEISETEPPTDTTEEPIVVNPTPGEEQPADTTVPDTAVTGAETADQEIIDDGTIAVDPTETVLGEVIGQSDSGQFVSEESKTLKLLVDWDYVILSDGSAQVTVNVGVSHYRISAKEKIDMGAITVDGATSLFSTPAFSREENTYAYTPFFSEVYTTTQEEMNIDVSWTVLGNYSGQDIESLNAGGTIVFQAAEAAE